MRDWYFQVMGQELGPFTPAELKAKVDAGQIQRDTLVRRGVEGKWLYADRVRGLLPEPEPQAPSIPLRMKPKSSASLAAANDLPIPRSADVPAPSQPRSSPAIIISLNEDDSADEAKPPSVEFYEFVGFREAISPVLHRAVRRYLQENSLTMTQLNRKALAAFIARPELAGDLMISALAVIPQPVNEKFNTNGLDPLDDEERMEHATFRVTLFNCSTTAVDVIGGEFVLVSVKKRDYDKVGTRMCPPLDHRGHIPVRLDDAQEGQVLSIPLKCTVQPLATATVFFWFCGKVKPSLTRARGHLRLRGEDEVAYSEDFTIIMHGDSPC